MSTQMKTVRRSLAIVLAVIIAVGMVPASVAAEAGTPVVDLTGEIIAFQEHVLPEGLTLARASAAPHVAVTVESTTATGAGTATDGSTTVDNTDPVTERSAAGNDTGTGTPDPTGITGTCIVTALHELPDHIRWQNTTVPELPETVHGTVEGDVVAIPVTWVADREYDSEYPERGLYVFTAALGEGYELGVEVEPPRITVFVPVTVAGGFAPLKVGSGTDDSPLIITTAAQLAEVATLMNAGRLEPVLFNDSEAKVHFVMGNDIDLSAYASGEGWTPIGRYDFPESKSFQGVFDGDGHKVTGLYINRADSDYGYRQGLFGHVGTGGEVRNLGVVNANIRGYSQVGGVAGYVDVGGTLENCYISGSVSGSNQLIGGVAGDVCGIVQNCYSAGSVSGLAYVGGVAGDVYGIVEYCYSSGSVSGVMRTGGVAGAVGGRGTLRNCAALNPSVSRKTTGTGDVGRVAGGKSSSSTLIGNVAWSGMTVNGYPVPGGTAEDENGLGVSAEDIASDAFWTLDGVFTEPWDADVWSVEAGNLPILTGLPGQAATIPDYMGGPHFQGDGTSTNPYRISTAEDLAKPAQLVNDGESFSGEHFLLEDDIDLSAVSGTISVKTGPWQGAPR